MECYKKKAGQPVTAVQLNIEDASLLYMKWGGTQSAQEGDWVVDNDGEVYTIEKESFAQTYKAVSPGRYEKVGLVWAVIAPSSGEVVTKEGYSVYEKGDFLVYNNKDGTDGYCMSAEKFNSMYDKV